MTTFHFQTHVSESGVITLPPDAMNLYGKDVVVNVDLPSIPKPKRSLKELAGIWGKEESGDDDWPTPTDEQLEKMYTLCRGCLEGVTEERYDQLRTERIMGGK